MLLLLGGLVLGAAVPGEDPLVEVVIPPGLSATATAELLSARGVIRSSLLFRLTARFTGAERRLKPGTYRLKPGLGVRAALRALTAGTSNAVRVLIPEGFSARQIAERLEGNGLCKASEFLKVVEPRRLEGYLFPTTYQIDKSWDASRIADRMHEEFRKRIPPEFERAASRPAMTLHQLLTLASIVEREAVIASEKPMIAAVYLNRLRGRRMLEADPTVQYALGYWKKGLTYADLRHPSPYNTYNHFGLPPGPICNPGLDSFLAVLSPARTDAIFFVADAKGGHTFTGTLEEHNKAKQRFKKDLREQRRR